MTRSGVLSAQSIEVEAIGRNMIIPYSRKNLQACSYDLAVDIHSPITLARFEFRLLTTQASFLIPNNIQGQVHTRSSVGRLGVLAHFTAGFIDPGFCGQITLEVMPLVESFTIMPGDRLAQIAFYWLDEPTELPYTGRYQNQFGPTVSRFGHGAA